MPGSCLNHSIEMGIIFSWIILRLMVLLVLQNPGKVTSGSGSIRILPAVFSIFMLKKGTKNTEFSIFDLHGQKVYSEKTLSRNGSITKELDLSGLSKGVYYIRLTTEDVTQVEKIIIK